MYERSATFLHGFDFIRQAGKIGGQNGRRELDHAKFLIRRRLAEF
jgi:hypothetical protein